MGVTHSTVATAPDDPDAEVNAAEWNDDHVVTGYATDTHTHSGADITSGTVADARVASTISRDSEVVAYASQIGHDHDGTPESKLAQANTHESPDTDVGTSSLHHTLGTGANQAAAGNHNHVLSALTAPAADVSMNSHKITNLTDGASAQDAVTKSQLDAAVAGGVSFGSVVAPGPDLANGTGTDVPHANHNHGRDDALAVLYETDMRILRDGLAGVGVVSGCAVTAQGSPDMTVAIAAGTIRIASGALVAVSGGNGTIGAADGSNPRIDLISASNAGVKTVTAGTAAASPKPPDLPAGNVALAYVLVPTSDTTISTGQIVDKRVVVVAPLAFADYRRTSGDYTTSSTSFVDVDGTNLNFSITTGAHRVRCVLECTIDNATLTAGVSLELLIDGVALGGGTAGTIYDTSGANNQTVHCEVMSDVLAAGSHTFKWQFKTNAAGTARLRAGTAAPAPPLRAWVEETPFSS